MNTGMYMPVFFLFRLIENKFYQITKIVIKICSRIEWSPWFHSTSFDLISKVDSTAVLMQTGGASVGLARRAAGE